MSEQNIHQVIEAALFTMGEPMSLPQLQQLFAEDARPSTDELKAALEQLQADYEARGIELVKVASGYRFQSKPAYAPWLQRLWQKRPPKFSRAALETLALIVYQQPITRGEIEQVRGVAVSSNIIKTLMDRHWIKIAGHRDVPGKPALFVTTKEFLSDFNLKNLSELPPLKEIVDLSEMEENVSAQLALETVMTEEETADMQERAAEMEEAVVAENSDELDDTLERV